LYALGRYLQLLFFPLALTHDYYPRHIDLMHFGDLRVWISGLAYLGLTGVAIYGTKRCQPLGLAVWFYLIPLSIVSNLVFPIGTHLAERLVFMPSIGFAMALGLLFFPVEKPSGSPGKLRLALLGSVVLLLSVRTIARNPVWKDNFTLFTTDIQTSPNSAKLRNAVAGSLVDRSREEKDSLVQVRLLREAVGHAQRATELHPFYANAFLIKGNAHFYLKEYDQAIAAYRKALDVSPGYKEALENLPLALRDAGRYAGEVRGDLPGAIVLLEEADRLRPNDYEILRLLGIAHGMSQNHQEAIRCFTQAAELNPTLPDAWTNLSTAYFASGNAAKGQEFLRKAQGLK
jgi:tetratricopeptide (TPR) repeat protein